MRNIITFSIILMCCLSVSIYSEKLEAVNINSEQQYGEVRSVKVNGDVEYITDNEYNVIAGPFKGVSSYNSFPLAEKTDGGQAMYDLDGTLLAEVGAEGSIHPVANGLYAVSPTVKSMDAVGEFIIYDYETRTEIGRTYKPFFYYLEEQNEKMFIDRDGKYAIIDKYGNYLTDFIYDGVIKRFNPDYDPYPKSYAIVTINEEEKYIDFELNEIDISDYNGERFITQFYHMTNNTGYFKEYYHAESDQMHAIYDKEEKKFVVPFQSDYGFGEMDDSIIIVKKDGRYGVSDYKLNILSEPLYDSLIFSEIEGFLRYRRGEVTGYFDISRCVEVSEIQGQVTTNGVMLNSYYDYSGEYRRYCTEIINFAGRNLAGEVYRFVEYKDGQFFKMDNYNSENGEVVEFDRNFTIINLNGKYLDFDGTIRDSRTLVPMREIVEGLGGKVDWSAKTRTATAYIDGKVISMTIGNNIITIDGVEQVIDVSAQLINEKTMLPVRALCENLGATVDWDERIRCVYINR